MTPPVRRRFRDRSLHRAYAPSRSPSVKRRARLIPRVAVVSLPRFYRHFHKEKNDEIGGGSEVHSLEGVLYDACAVVIPHPKIETCTRITLLTLLGLFFRCQRRRNVHDAKCDQPQKCCKNESPHSISLHDGTECVECLLHEGGCKD